VKRIGLQAGLAGRSVAALRASLVRFPGRAARVVAP
jgi:hypothetical protein